MSSGTSDIVGHLKRNSTFADTVIDIQNCTPEVVKKAKSASNSGSKKASKESINESTKAIINCDHRKVCNNNNYSSRNLTKSGNMLNSTQNLSKTKSLSFLHDQDDSSDDSSSISPLPKIAETKWDSTSPTLAINTDHQNGQQSNSTASNKNSAKALNRVENVHEDASSTSSCSCEDHTSVDSQSEELHDLDYDEDSITNSPTNNTNQLNDINGSTNDSQNSSSMQVTDKQSPSILGSEQSIFEQPESEILGKEVHEESQPASTSKDSSTKEKSQLENHQTPRIRSFVNVDRASIDPIDQAGLRATKKSSNDKSQKSYESLLKYFFKDTCYFQIKSINHENVKLSKSMGVWSTPIQNEIRLNTAFREHRNVILIFSVQQSGRFQGFARMISEARPPTRTIPWVLPERLSNRSLGGVFQVEWLCTKELPFHEVQNLYNPYNDNKPVKVARDGQQVEPSVGKKLCKLFPKDSKTQLLNSITTLKYQSSQRKKMSNNRHNLYPFPTQRNRPTLDRPNYIPPYCMNEIPSDPAFMANHMNPEFFGLDINRPFDRRRMFEPQNPGLCRSGFTSPSWRPARPYSSIPSPRHMIPHMDSSLHPHQAYPLTEPPFHSYQTREHNFHTQRYHPYQRSRR